MGGDCWKGDVMGGEATSDTYPCGDSRESTGDRTADVSSKLPFASSDFFFFVLPSLPPSFPPLPPELSFRTFLTDSVGLRLLW